MRGSVNWQINTIFIDSGIFQPGTSKHTAKIEAKEQLKAAGMKMASPNVADKTAMYGYSANDYKDTWHTFGHYCKQELGVKDMTKIETRHVQSYLEKRMVAGIEYGTWNKEAAHLAKFGNALDRYDGKERGFRHSIKDLRSLAKDHLPRSSKKFGGFQQPGRVYHNLNDKYALAAKIQHEGGARLREAALIKESQLRGLQVDPITGQEKGVIHLTDTKGGKPRDIQVTPATYKKIELAIKDSGEIRVDRSAYRAAVSRAAKAAGEQRTGTHDFRYCFAKARYDEVVSKGYTHEQALQQTSWEMGHERADITTLYLR